MIHVVKANGKVEPFSEEKVINSIYRARIPKEMQDEVLRHVKDRLYDEITTQEIHQHISEFLGKSSQPFLKATYNLKRAIMDLGPTGYPFEDFIARLLNEEGFKTKTRTIVHGRCIPHEIDVIAEKDAKKIMIEAKFHNTVGVTTNVHVPMYTKSRFEDVRTRNAFDEVWLVTNTKATTDAITYGQCVGMKVISWSYPEKESLRDLIAQHDLYPVTAISNLTLQHKAQLLQHNIVACRDICHDASILNVLELPQSQIDSIIAEAGFVCDLHP